MALSEAVDRIRHELYRAEYFSDADFDFAVPASGTREQARFLDWYREIEEKRTPEVARAFRSTLNRSLERFGRIIPQHSPNLFTAPLADFVPDLGRLIEEMIEPFFSCDRRLFTRLRKRLTKNIEAVDNQRPTRLGDRLGPSALVHAYFGGTVFEPLFREPIPLPFNRDTRYQGHWILARPRGGKTQAMACLINEDLKQVIEGKASVVVMDSQGNTAGGDGKPATLLYSLSHLKLFAPGQPLHGKLTYISADDIRPIPFNLFDLGLPGTPEAKFAASRRLMSFVFSGLVGEAFTGTMDRIFSACLRVMLTIPGTTLADMRRLLHADGPKRFRDEIAALTDEDDRNLFQTINFGSPTVSAVLSRLEGIKSYPLIEKMFAHPRTALNLFDEIEQGRVIIIDTNAGVLEDGCSIMGRFFIAMLGAVSRRRITVPECRKTPCFVYIDELADYCKKDQATAHLGEILAFCRKQNIAICMANQRMSQLSSDQDLLDGLKQCAIKFANPLSEDAYKIATEMGETPAKSLTNRADGSFGVHIAGMHRAVSVRVPFPTLSAQPYMTREEYDQMWEAMRDRYAPERGGEPPPDAGQDVPPSDPPPVPPQSGPEAPPYLDDDEDRGFSFKG